MDTPWAGQCGWNQVYLHGICPRHQVKQRMVWPRGTESHFCNAPTYSTRVENDADFFPCWWKPVQCTDLKKVARGLGIPPEDEQFCTKNQTSAQLRCPWKRKKVTWTSSNTSMQWQPMLDYDWQQTHQNLQVFLGKVASDPDPQWHPTLTIIVSGSEDKRVRIWQANTYCLESTLHSVSCCTGRWTKWQLVALLPVGLAGTSCCTWWIPLYRDAP